MEPHYLWEVVTMNAATGRVERRKFLTRDEAEAYRRRREEAILKWREPFLRLRIALERVA